MRIERVFRKQAPGFLAVEVAETEILQPEKNPAAQLDHLAGHDFGEFVGPEDGEQVVQAEQRGKDGGGEQHVARVARGHRTVDDVGEDQRARRDGEAAQQREADARREGAADPPQITEKSGRLERLVGHDGAERSQGARDAKGLLRPTDGPAADLIVGGGAGYRPRGGRDSKGRRERCCRERRDGR